MEKFIIKKDKVILTIPAKQQNELYGKVSSIIDEWGEYQKPKVERISAGKMKLKIDHALANKFMELQKGNFCGICNHKLGEGHFGYVSQAMPGQEEIIIAVVCPNCFSHLVNVLDMLRRFNGRIKAKYWAGKKRLQEVIECPACECKGVIKGNKINWSNKESTYYGGGETKFVCKLKEGDRVKIIGGKDAGKKGTVCSGMFINTKRSFNVTRDGKFEKESSTATVELGDLVYLAKKVKKASFKKIKRLARKLKRRGL